MLNLFGPQQATESYRIYDGSFDLYFFPHALGDLKKYVFTQRTNRLDFPQSSHLSHMRDVRSCPLLDVPRWRNAFSQHFISIIIKDDKV